MTSRELLLLVDVDDVIAQMLGEGWLPMYNRDFDDNLTPEDITDWEIRDFVKPQARMLFLAIYLTQICMTILHLFPALNTISAY